MNIVVPENLDSGNMENGLLVDVTNLILLNYLSLVLKKNYEGLATISVCSSLNNLFSNRCLK